MKTCRERDASLSGCTVLLMYSGSILIYIVIILHVDVPIVLKEEEDEKLYD